MLSLQEYQFSAIKPIWEDRPLTISPRLPHAVILSAGGWENKELCNIVECYDHIAERWTKVFF